MNSPLRLAALVLVSLAAWGCAGPEYVFEGAESPIFLGHGNLLTARRGAQEVNVRRITEKGVNLRRTWLDTLPPEGRSFRFQPERGRVLSVGLASETDHPLRSGSPDRRREVEAALLEPWTMFSIHAWPGGDALATRNVSPGLDISPDGSRVLRRSRGTQFELAKTSTGEVLATGPPCEPRPSPDLGSPSQRTSWEPGNSPDLGSPSQRTSSELDLGPPARLSDGLFLPEGRFAYCWQGTLFRGELDEGGKLKTKRVGPGDALAAHGERIFVLEGHKWLRAFEAETLRPLWQVDVSGLPEHASEAPVPWKLQLSPDGSALALVTPTALMIVRTSHGESLQAPRALFPVYGFEQGGIDPIYFAHFVDEGLALGNRHFATYDPSGHRVEVWAFGASASLFSYTLDDDELPFGDVSLSHDGAWLAISAGSKVQVWKLLR